MSVSLCVSFFSLTLFVVGVVDDVVCCEGMFYTLHHERKEKNTRECKENEKC